MKPLNLDNRPCSPVSSNCIVWQGPDIECINLCKGDTISDVVAAMATELCTILDQLNVSNYDLACLGITACGPNDFQALIQLLIDKVCEDHNAIESDTRTSTTRTSGNCPDCVVTVASCFRTGNQTTMQLLDYVQMIADKVCALISSITIINQQIDQLTIRVETLENTPIPEPVIPSFTLGCQIGILPQGSQQFINVALQEFINNVWCPFQAVTGTTTSLISAISEICITDIDLQLATGTPFSTNPNWVQSASYNTVADAITNLWVALCDVRTAVENSSVIVAGSTWIDVSLSTVGLVETYTVSEIEKPGLSVELSAPANLLKTAPGLNTGRICDGSIQIMNTINYNDFGLAYDSTTGIFTFPTDGVYIISFATLYTKDSADGWHDALVPGMFIAGITSPIGCRIYCVNNDTPVVTQKHASINGSLIQKFTAGTQICLKVINLTTFDYLSETDDYVRFSIQRVK
jgi:hypothetical protein